MKLKKVMLTLAGVLMMSHSFSALGQSGYWEIPPEWEGEISTYFLDSLRAKALEEIIDHGVDYKRLGKFVWNGTSGVNWSPDAPNKFKATVFTCFENGWLKLETQFDSSNNTKDYETQTACYGVLCNDFWTENIEIDVVDKNEIIINSPIDVIAEIHKAVGFGQPMVIMKFFVEGTGNVQSFQVDLANYASYIMVFTNGDNEIVYIKRIGGNE